MNKLQVSAVTHPGKVREENEDSIAVAGFISSAAAGYPMRLWAESERPVGCLVADGLGGHAEGARASKIAAYTISDAILRSASADAVVAAVSDANSEIYREMSCLDAWRGMGTTVVAAVFSNGQMTCVNVGDSRCYQIAGETMVQLSVDDSPPPAPGQPGAATQTIVTQTLGGARTPVAVHPHVHVMEVKAGHRFLLCSDGLSDYVELDAIEQCLARAADDASAVQLMLDAALDAGGPDNISIVLMTVLA
jgi:PPM family protein phosphatase